MKEFVSAFVDQLTEAVEIGKKAAIAVNKAKIDNVVIMGLGGSGIGGTIVSEIISNECPVPILANKDYEIPSFVGPNTLFIASSYSGNTEETLTAFETAKQKGAQLFCISSGGKLIERARELGVEYITVPGGKPPRACLSYSLVQLLFIFNAKGLINDAFLKQIETSKALILKQEEQIKAEAQAITDKIFNKIPVIYGFAGYEGAAIRFRQQLNENSKILCWHQVIPEMNHNELVGWTNKHDELAVIFMLNDDAYGRNQTRKKINEEIISKYVDTIVDIKAQGSTKLERTLYLIHICDWVSCYLADKRSVDPIEIRVIEYLKGTLAKI